MWSFIRSKNLLYFVAGFSTALTISTLYLMRISDGQDPHHQRAPTKSMKSGLRRRKVLFFGDSITQHGFNTDIQGWVAKLGNWWTRRVDLLNRGYSGYNTRWARQVIEDVVVNESPDFVFIFFGANDAVDTSVLQHVPLEEYRDNMRFMASIVKKRLPGVPVVLITPPPVWEEKLQFFNKQKGKPLLIDRENERTLQYVEVVKEIGKEFDIPVLDAWSAMEGFSNDRGTYLSDGLHLNDKGCNALFSAAQKVIEKFYPDWLPEVMPMQLPEWSQIPADNIIRIEN